MNAFVKPLGRGLEIHLETEVIAARREGAGWRIETPAALFERPFDIVACTIPAPQAYTLFAAEAEAARLAEVEIAPCLALMAAFAAPLGLAFDFRRRETAELAWIARNSSKPGRGDAAETWVAHASPAWSRRHLELSPREIQEAMLPLLAAELDCDLPKLVYVSAHRWRYALVSAPLGEPYLACADGSLFFGGDWCLGPRVEFAYESGRGIAEAILARIGQ